MKRSIAAISVLALVLLSTACATTTAATPTPSVQGVVTAIDGRTVTVTPASGTPSTVNVDYATSLFWYTGVEAGRSELIVGHRVSVWLKNGSQNASRVVIERSEGGGAA
jgi:hypothetical protein